MCSSIRRHIMLSYLALCSGQSHQGTLPRSLPRLVNYLFLFMFIHFLKLYFMKLKKIFFTFAKQLRVKIVPIYEASSHVQSTTVFLYMWYLRLKEGHSFPRGPTVEQRVFSLGVLPYSVLSRIIIPGSFPLTTAPDNCSSSLRNGRREEIRNCTVQARELLKTKIISRIFPGVSSHFDSLVLITIPPLIIITLGHCLILCGFQNKLTKRPWLQHLNFKLCQKDLPLCSTFFHAL